MSDEVKLHKVVIDLPALPRGYRYTGEYRPLVAGESFLNQYGVLLKFASPSERPYHIVEKERWAPKKGDTVWYLADMNEVVSLQWYGNESFTINLFKTEAIAEIARLNIHALLTEADLNNMD